MTQEQIGATYIYSISLESLEVTTNTSDQLLVLTITLARMSQSRNNELTEGRPVSGTDEQNAFNKLFRKMGRSPVTEKNINNEYLRHPPPHVRAPLSLHDIGNFPIE